MPRPKRIPPPPEPEDHSSAIPMKPRHTRVIGTPDAERQQTAVSILATHYAPRQPEQALSRGRTRLTKNEFRLLHLERVGKQPQHYPRDSRRPVRPKYGDALWAWMAEEMNARYHVVMTVLEIQKALDDVTEVMKRRARAGLE